MLATQKIPQEPFLHAVREASDQLQARCKHCPLPPTVTEVRAWDQEVWLQVWADAAGAARRRAGFALNDGLTDEAGRGYWLAAVLYGIAARFLNPECGDPRHTLLTTGEAACLRMASMLSVAGVDPEENTPRGA